MPCYDERTSPSYNAERIADLQARNDKLMRVICTIDKTLGLTAAQLAACGAEVTAVVLSHRKTDQLRAAMRKKAEASYLKKKR